MIVEGEHRHSKNRTHLDIISKMTISEDNHIKVKTIIPKTQEENGEEVMEINLFMASQTIMSKETVVQVPTRIQTINTKQEVKDVNNMEEVTHMVNLITKKIEVQMGR